MAARRSVASSLAHNPTPESVIPPPYNTVYTGRDADEDRLITTMMLADEALAEPFRNLDATGPDETQYAEVVGGAPLAFTEDFAELVELCSRIVAWVRADAAHGKMLAAFREGLADGELLRGLFRNLFPEGLPKRSRDATGKKVLTQREVDVIRLVAMGLSHDEIAARLCISRKTVGRHVENSYRKLGVHNPMQAAARAYNMGYLDIGGEDVVLLPDSSNQRGFEALSVFLARSELPVRHAYRASLSHLAEFGAFAIALAGTTGPVFLADAYGSGCLGAICRFDPSGRLDQFTALPGTGYPCAIAVANEKAADHGFAPSHVYVGRCLLPQRGTGDAEIVELSADGSARRTIRGGRSVAARLSGEICLAFAEDGRLLAGSRTVTDQILAFSDAGRTVEALAHSSCCQIACSPTGEIYGTQQSGIGSVVRVFDPSGRTVRTIGGTTMFVDDYGGIAVTRSGRVLVNLYRYGRGSDDAVDGTIEEYTAAGAHVRTIRVPGLAKGMLAVGSSEGVYACCERSGDVAVLSADGRVVRRIDLDGRIVPKVVAVGDDGRIWVCGPTMERWPR